MLNIYFIGHHTYYIYMDVSRGNASGLKWEGRVAVDNEAREDSSVSDEFRSQIAV